MCPYTFVETVLQQHVTEFSPRSDHRISVPLDCPHLQKHLLSK